MVTEAMLTKVCQGGRVKMDGLVEVGRGSQFEQVSMCFWGCSGFTRVIAVVGRSSWSMVNFAIVTWLVKVQKTNNFHAFILSSIVQSQKYLWVTLYLKHY